MSQTAASSVSTAPVGVTARQGRECAPLLRRVRGEGLLGRRRGWYARMISVNLLALAAVVTGFVLAGDAWWTLLLAVHMAGDMAVGGIVGSFTGGLATRKLKIDFAGKASHAQ
ncbi:hypothetical protein [Streptomyces sp. MK37H]|uniref:hypothetical protein n=1 Tax=Streptomyces sp. MK37H TaxID=2699117 RepID=UPI0035A91A6F